MALSQQRLPPTRAAIPGANRAVASPGRSSGEAIPEDCIDMMDGMGNARIVELLKAGVENPAPESEPVAPKQAFEMATSGAPSPVPHKDEMENRFSMDLGGVEAHLGTPEAQAGLAMMDAEAATVGDKMAFASASPAPDLVAHEVAHLAQKGTPAPESANKLSSPSEGAEQEAEQIAQEAAAGGSPDVEEQAAPNTVHRSFLGALVGGLGGAITGAVAGYLAGGLTGAIVGGITGAVAGALIGNALPPTPVPILTDDQRKTAIAFNAGRMGDAKSVQTVQGAVGTAATGSFDNTTVDAIANYQKTNGMAVNGKVDEATLGKLVDGLAASNFHDNAILLIVDYYGMPTANLASISYDAAVTVNGTTSGAFGGPQTVKIGPAIFGKGLAALIHTIRHELEHVQQRAGNLASKNVREFRAESIEIISSNMPEEGVAGFMDDASRCKHYWDLMTADEMIADWAQFVDVRTKVNDRHTASTAAEQTVNQALVDAYNAVVQPAAP